MSQPAPTMPPGQQGRAPGTPAHVRAGDWIEAHRRAWEGRLDRFERYVERAGG